MRTYLEESGGRTWGYFIYRNVAARGNTVRSRKQLKLFVELWPASAVVPRRTTVILNVSRADFLSRLREYEGS